MGVELAFYLKGRSLDEQKDVPRRGSWENHVGRCLGQREDRQETSARGAEDWLECEGRKGWKQVAGKSPRNSIAL